MLTRRSITVTSWGLSATSKQDVGWFGQPFPGKKLHSPIHVDRQICRKPPRDRSDDRDRDYCPRHLCFAASSGRFAAEFHAAGRVRKRQLHERRASEDGNAHYASHRKRGQPRSRHSADQLDVVRRYEQRRSAVLLRNEYRYGRRRRTAASCAHLEHAAERSESLTADDQ